MTWKVWACKINSRCIRQESLPVSAKLIFCCVSGKHNTATGQTQFNIQKICTPKSWWSLYKTKITMKCWVGQCRLTTYSSVNMNFIQIHQKVTFWHRLSAICMTMVMQTGKRLVSLSYFASNKKSRLGDATTAKGGPCLYSPKPK